MLPYVFEFLHFVPGLLLFIKQVLLRHLQLPGQLIPLQFQSVCLSQSMLQALILLNQGQSLKGKILAFMKNELSNFFLKKILKTKKITFCSCVEYVCKKDIDSIKCE